MKTLKYSWRFLMRSKSYTIIQSGIQYHLDAIYP